MIIWSGQLELAGSTPEAVPWVAARRDDAALIQCAGAFTADAALALADLAFHESRQPSIRILVFDLTSTCGEIQGLPAAASVVDAIPESVARVAFLNHACGPALCWALRCCHLLYASPTARLGFLQVRTADGQLDFDLTQAMGAAMVVRYPHVRPKQWARLLHHGICGEHAEAAGIVGGLRRKATDLLGGWKS